MSWATGQQHASRYRARTPTSTTSSAGTSPTNTELAAAVDQALAVLERRGARAAADLLQAHVAGFALTRSVLAEPARHQPGPAGRPAGVAHHRA